KKRGAGSSLYKTTDGGQTWHKLTKGLPTSKLGRIGLDYFRKDPNVLFAIVDCEKIGMGLPPKSGATVYVDVFGEDGENGVRLFSVRDNGPSAKAGLMVDDIVQTIDGKAITKADQLVEEIRNHKVGDKVKFKVLRGEKTVEITVTLERRPEQPGEGAPARAVYLGLAGEDAEGGVRVTAVAAGGPAVTAGIQNDDVIQQLGDKPVQGFEQMLEQA